MDKIPKIDKEILGRFFPGYKYEQYEAAENNKQITYYLKQVGCACECLVIYSLNMRQMHAVRPPTESN